MATTTQLLTFEEFIELPLWVDDKRFELVHGEVVEVLPAKLRHTLIQVRIAKLLRAFVKSDEIMTEFPFYTADRRNYRIVDVAYISAERLERAKSEDYFLGSAELVVEVESPSNTAQELKDREVLCLANGCREFWTVYPKLKRVQVATPEGAHTYKPGDDIPLTVFPVAAISVDRIFED